jgi:hypothetical protein
MMLAPSSVSGGAFGKFGKNCRKKETVKRIAGLPEKGTIFTRIGQNPMHL